MMISSAVPSSYINGKPNPPMRPIVTARLDPIARHSVGNYSNVVTVSKLYRIYSTALVDIVTTYFT